MSGIRRRIVNLIKIHYVIIKYRRPDYPYTKEEHWKYLTDMAMRNSDNPNIFIEFILLKINELLYGKQWYTT